MVRLNVSVLIQGYKHGTSKAAKIVVKASSPLSATSEGASQ
jgi:hypothetical protein